MSTNQISTPEGAGVRGKEAPEERIEISINKYDSKQDRIRKITRAVALFAQIAGRTLNIRADHDKVVVEGIVIDPDVFGDTQDAVDAKLADVLEKLGFEMFTTIEDDPESAGIEYHGYGHKVQLWHNCECNPSRERCIECEDYEVLVVIEEGEE